MRQLRLSIACAIAQSLKVHSHRAKAEVEVKIFFDVCLFFYLDRFHFFLIFFSHSLPLLFGVKRPFLQT